MCIRDRSYEAQFEGEDGRYMARNFTNRALGGLGRDSQASRVQPVSYTHLSTSFRGSRVIGVRNVTEHAGATTFISVSYTHLDVYKRQEMNSEYEPKVSFSQGKATITVKKGSFRVTNVTNGQYLTNNHMELLSLIHI